jgi:hypothetical protein
MSVRKRIEKYRRSGGAADLVKVEVLVPPSARDDVLRLAARLRPNTAKTENCVSYVIRRFRFMARASWTMSISIAFPTSAPAPASLRER